MIRRVTLYGRPGCCLCDDAREVIERVRRRLAFDLQEHDIEADEDLLRRYLERIPVVAIDGRDAFELFLDETAFETALKAPQSA
ncbi:MAG TPA: glutaredoxin family protein [Solirubrobacteraceae bacterium]|nr:glutaredoxin family protein [Solirubrobacteraceae bacterium]